jgi:hypothetical protein
VYATRCARLCHEDLVRVIEAGIMREGLRSKSKYNESNPSTRNAVIAEAQMEATF